MRRLSLLVALCAALAVAGIQIPVNGQANRSVGQARLSGDSENPPVETNGRGQASVFLNPNAGEIGFRLSVTNVVDMTQAHIHCGSEEVNGPVVAFLFGLIPGGSTVNGLLASGTITDADVVPRGDSAECPGGVGDLADLMRQIRAGNTYVNVHTLANPGGEVRGQIVSR